MISMVRSLQETSIASSNNLIHNSTWTEDCATTKNPACKQH
jgi:hypothetical protein